MARFFFHLHERGKFIQDDEGVERSDTASIYAEALRAAREVMCAEVAEGRLSLDCHIEVRDAAGETVMTVPFKDAVAITGL